MITRDWFRFKILTFYRLSNPKNEYSYFKFTNSSIKTTTRISNKMKTNYSSANQKSVESEGDKRIDLTVPIVISLILRSESPNFLYSIAFFAVFSVDVSAITEALNILIRAFDDGVTRWRVIPNREKALLLPILFAGVTVEKVTEDDAMPGNVLDVLLALSPYLLSWFENMWAQIFGPNFYLKGPILDIQALYIYWISSFQ